MDIDPGKEFCCAYSEVEYWKKMAQELWERVVSAEMLSDDEYFDGQEKGRPVIYTWGEHK
jgi:hypothetical protein